MKLWGALLSCAALTSAQKFLQPEQIHLSYPGSPSSMMVTWVTFSPTPTTEVEYGEGRLDTRQTGDATNFTDGGSEKRLLFIHRVLLTKLKPGATYIYHVGSAVGWSSIFYFTTMKADPTFAPRFAVYGDFGLKNAQSLGRLQQEVQRGSFDAILHVGDMAYDMEVDNARVGDQWMRSVEPMAAYLPYMVVPGNHENAYNFSNYVNRFSMPDFRSQGNHFYSFDMGPVHVIGFSTEFFYFVEYGWTQIATQYAWLENDLKKAQANRANVPWIVTLGHRPMYCSNADRDDCTKYESIVLVRGGLPLVHAYALEPLFFKYGVDLEVWAHEHSYERMWPLYNRTVYNGTKEPYTDPVAPVHIVTGSSGCQENTDAFILKTPIWSAFRSSEYGFSRMTVHNASHLYWEQVSDDQEGKVIDTMWIVKSKHGPYDPAAMAAADGTYVPLSFDAGRRRVHNVHRSQKKPRDSSRGGL